MTSLTIENGLLARVAVNFWRYLLSQPMTHFRVAEHFIIGVFVGQNNERLALVYSDEIPHSPTPAELREILGRAAHYQTRRIYRLHRLPFLIDTLERARAMYIMPARSLDGTPVTLLLPRPEVTNEVVDCTLAFYLEDNFPLEEMSQLIVASPDHRMLYARLVGYQLNVGFVARDHEVIILHRQRALQIVKSRIEILSSWSDGAMVS